MKLESLKDLDKLMILCRKRGIKTFKLDNIEFNLADVEYTETRQKPRKAVAIEPLTNTDNVQIDTNGWDSLTDDEKLFYSASGQVPPGNEQ